MSRWFCSSLQIWNLSIISSFITVCIFCDGSTDGPTHRPTHTCTTFNIRYPNKKQISTGTNWGVRGSELHRTTASSLLPSFSLTHIKRGNKNIRHADKPTNRQTYTHTENEKREPSNWRYCWIAMESDPILCNTECFYTEYFTQCINDGLETHVWNQHR